MRSSARSALRLNSIENWKKRALLTLYFLSLSLSF
jgi:hypothetical protein